MTICYTQPVHSTEVNQASEPAAISKYEGRRPRWQTLARSPWFIAAVALAFRILVLTVGHFYRITPRRDHFDFGWEMGRIARSLAMGEGFSSPTDLPTGPTAWAAPLYPYLLAGIFKLAGVYTHSAAFLVFTANSIFSALTCVSLYGTGKRTFGETTARWCAWTWALLPYAVYWSVRTVWETTLSALLLSLAFLLVLRLDEEANRRDWIWFGVLWGVITLTNPTLLSFLPVALLWLWHRLRGRRRRLLRQMAGSMLLAGLIITPWLVRNYLVFGCFVFVRDNFGLELRVANNPKSGGIWKRAEHPGNDPAQMRLMQQMGELPYMQMMQREALDFIRRNPAAFAMYTVRRFAYFWAGKPQWAGIGGFDLAPARHMAFLLTALFPLAGLVLAIRKSVPSAWLFAWLLIVFPLPYYIAHSTPRYRHPIEPEMLLLIVYLVYEARRIEVPLPGWMRKPRQFQI
ncbi:MAG: ArnT family glycosyltransferase [Terriglobales bacterium]